MTFKFVSIFHDFPGKFIFPGFSMIFHDRGNPDKSSCRPASCLVCNGLWHQHFSLLQTMQRKMGCDLMLVSVMGLVFTNCANVQHLNLLSYLSSGLTCRALSCGSFEKRYWLAWVQADACCLGNFLREIWKHHEIIWSMVQCSSIDRRIFRITLHSHCTETK